MVLIGCATMMAASVPGETMASNTLKADILRMINIFQKANAPGCSYKVINTKFAGKEDNSIREDWTVLSCGKEVIYPVRLIPDPSGGTYFSVSTPEAYIKK